HTDWVGLVYTSYLSLGNHKVLYYLIKEGGRHDEMIKPYEDFFENNPASQLLEDEEDGNGFMERLLNASKRKDENSYSQSLDNELLHCREGFVYAVTERSRKFAESLVRTMSNEVAEEELFARYKDTAAALKENITGFNKALKGIDLCEELRLIFRENRHPEFF